MLMTEYDYDTDMAVQCAVAEQRGEARGKLEGKLETARNLLEIGINKLQIAKAPGLSIEEIEAL